MVKWYFAAHEWTKPARKRVESRFFPTAFCFLFALIQLATVDVLEFPRLVPLKRAHPAELRYRSRQPRCSPLPGVVMCTQTHHAEQEFTPAAPRWRGAAIKKDVGPMLSTKIEARLHPHWHTRQHIPNPHPQQYPQCTG